MPAGGTKADWDEAAKAMLERATQTATSLKNGFPHWANAETGEWTTTPDGDWTGGAFPGILWLGYHMTGDERVRALAHDWCARLRPRAKLETAFKGFGFYCGAALGQIFADDKLATTIALEAAESLLQQFDRRLGLIPLGKDAEEHGEVGKAFSSIDSLQAVPLLFWAGKQTGNDAYAKCASSHTTRVLDIHCRPDGSIIQSSELDANTGATTRHFTHKGVSDTSVWGPSPNRAAGGRGHGAAGQFLDTTMMPNWFTWAGSSGRVLVSRDAGASMLITMSFQTLSSSGTSSPRAKA